jgi:histidyl-tRNA synthetase
VSAKSWWIATPYGIAVAGVRTSQTADALMSGMHTASGACRCPPRCFRGRQRVASQYRGFKTVRGMRDVLPPESRRLAYLRAQGVRSAELAGYAPISTPILEEVGVFTHALGEASDVVSKEMYTLEDRRGAKLCLRPENTAGVARAIGASPLVQARELPQRFHYDGPMFRYERPQRGRYRQFEQFGVERFDHTDATATEGIVRDAEVVGVAAHFLHSVGVLHAVELQLNFLGDSAARARYSTAMADFLATRRSELSEASQERLDRGSVLRILDSKSPADATVLGDAPLLADFLGAEAAARAEATHAAIVAVLAEIPAAAGAASGGGVSVVVNPRLVRGLDYYTDTVFEFVSVGSNSAGNGKEKKVGAQSTVLAGGSYGGLVASLQAGGKQRKAAAQVTGVGFSAGIDRLSLLLEEAAPELCARVDATPPHVAVLPAPPAGSDGDLSADASVLSLRVAQHLRSAGVTAVGYGSSGSLQQLLGRAVSNGASHAVFVSRDRSSARTVTAGDLESVAMGLKDLSKGTQVDVQGMRALLDSLGR